MIIFVFVLVLVVIWAWAADSKNREHAKLCAAMLAPYKLEGSEKDIRYLCAKLINQEDYLYEIMQKGSATFGEGGKLYIPSVPVITTDGNIALIEKDGHKWEVTKLTIGEEKYIRIAEQGPRGGLRNSLQLGERELLTALADLGIVWEDINAGD